MVNLRNSSIIQNLALSLIFVMSLASCNLPMPTPAPSDLDESYHTALANLSATAAENETIQGTPIPDVSETSQNPTSETIEYEELPNPPINPTVCNHASAGTPFDITIPDGTVMKPGQSFSKTWRLVNSGSCLWTRDYAVVWFFGDDLGLSRVRYLNRTIEPGESIDITVDMYTPNKPGIYQSYWKLRDPNGELFGFGPNAEAPFWARIEVIEESTPTPSPTPTVTPTPPTYAAGTALLFPEDRLDLDNGEIERYKEQPTEEISSDNYNDLLLEKAGDDEFILSPLNAIRLGIYGELMPEIGDCEEAVLIDEPIPLRDVLSGETYICYTTNLGLPGYLRIITININGDFITLEFLTWAIP